MRLNPALLALGLCMLVSVQACIYPYGSRTKSAADPDKHFDYNFAGTDWPTHNSSKWTCSGNRQSPLLLHVANAPASVLPESFTTFKYGSLDSSTMDLDVINNGHTFQLNFPNASVYQANVTIVVAGDNATLVDAFENPSSAIASVRATPLQLHFHARSEHVLDGITYPLEMHIVHVVSQEDWPACPAGGCLLVLGMVFHLEDDESKAIPALETILTYAPMNEDGSAMIPRGMKVDIDSLVPEKRDHVKYSGSLTAPPCTEGILWHVMTQSLPITQKQLTKAMFIMGDKECKESPSKTEGASGRRLSASGGDASGPFAWGADGCRNLETAHNWRDVQAVNGRPIKVIKAAA